MLVSHAMMFVVPIAAGLWQGRNGGYLSLRVAGAAAIVQACVPAALILFSEPGVGNDGNGSIWGLVLLFGALSWPGALLFARSYGARRRHHKSERLT